MEIPTESEGAMAMQTASATRNMDTNLYRSNMAEPAESGGNLSEISNQNNVQQVPQNVQGSQTSFYEQPGGVNNYFNMSNSSVNINSEKANACQSDYPTAFENIVKSTKLCLKQLRNHKFVETRAFKEARGRLEAFGVVVLTGRQGDGKTAIGQRCLQSLAKKRRPVMMTDPYDWDTLPRPLKWRKLTEKEKYVVLIDNIFGFDQVCPTIKHRWMSKFDQMWQHVLYGHVALILVFRTSVFHMCQEQLSHFKLFQTTHILSLSNPKYQLNEREMIEMAKFHMVQPKSHENIDIESISSCLPNIAFPQICHFYAVSKKVQGRGLDYFQNPIEYITKELKILREQNSVQYYILVLTMMLRGQLSKQLFYTAHTTSDMQKKHDDLEVAEQVRRLIPFRFDMNTTNFESVADSMIGVYFSYSKRDRMYRFLHPVIEDSLLLSFCDIQLQDIIAISPVRVLNQYMRTPNCSHTESNLAIQISRKEEIYLAERIAKELTEGDYLAALTNLALKNDGFVRLLTEGVLKEEGCRMISTRNIGLVHVHKRGPFEYTTDMTTFDAPQIPKRVVGNTDKWLCNFKTLLCFIVMQNLPNLAYMITKQLPYYFERRLLRCACFMGNASVTRHIIANIHTPQEDLHIREVFICCVASDAESIPVLNTLLKWIDDSGLNEISEDFPSLLVDLLKLSVALQKAKYLKILLRVLGKYDFRTAVLNDLLHQLTVQLVSPSEYPSHTDQSSNYKVIGDLLSLLIKEGADGYHDRLVFLAAQCQSSYLLEQFLDHLEWRDTEYTTGTEYIVERREAALAKEKNAKCVSGRTPLLEASKRCRDSVQLLLKHGADVNAVDSDGYSILHSSLIYSDADTLKHILKMKTSSHLPDQGNLKTPLHVACEYAMIESFDMLLWHYSDVNMRQLDGRTALHVAINSNVDSLAKIDALIKAGANVHETGDATPVIHTAVSSYLYTFPKVKALIQAGASVDTVDKYGETVLHSAAAHGRLETLEMLLDLGLDVNQTDTQGETPLHRVLCGSGWESRRTVNKDVVHLFVTRGANVMFETKNGETPVYIGASSYNVTSDVLDIILKNNHIHPFRVIQLRKNPLHRASSIEKVQRLIQHGFCPSAECAQQCLTALVTNSTSCVMDWLNWSQDFKTPTEEQFADTWEQYIEILCAKGADVNLLSNEGQTLLQVAISNRSTEMVMCLLKKGADPNIKDICGNIIPYHYDYRKRKCLIIKHKILQLLVKAGARFNESSNRYAMLMHCARRGLWKCLQLLLDSDINTDIWTLSGRSLVHSTVTSWKCMHIVLQHRVDVNLQDILGITALHLVAGFRWSGDKISFLVYHGAHPNIQDILGRTPLVISSLLSESLKKPQKEKKLKPKKIHGRETHTKPVMKKDKTRKVSLHPWGYNKNVEVLLKHGADGDIKTLYGDTALHIAVENCNYGLLCILVKGGCSADIKDAEGNTPLHLTLISPIKKKTKIIKALVNGKSDVNVQNARGDTALHIACWQGLAYVVSLLMEKGADSEVTNSAGDTPLHIATQRGWWKCVKALLDKGADPDAENQTEETPLHLAASRGHSRTMEALIDAGADVDYRDMERCTPLHKAAKNGHARAGKLLIENGCDINTVNQKDETVLHVAAKYGQVKMGQMLVDNECDIDVVNGDGDSPLHISVREIRYRMTRFLLMAGADHKMQNSNRETALDICLSIIRSGRGFSYQMDRILYMLKNTGSSDKNPLQFSSVARS